MINWFDFCISEFELLKYFDIQYLNENDLKMFHLREL